MNDPQIWTVIGVFAAMMLGGFTMSTSLLARVVRVSIDGLEKKMDARFEAVDTRFMAVDARFAAVDARLEAVNTRLDHLDRDVSALVRRAWDDRTEP
ncbi:MAG: hypothetical protein QM675_09505 [Protaetiibacter sp.]